ncbi:MAG: DUF4340 domain-containing protein [Syntrophobacteraceae bacterium]|nr:DUF4340 domain-containing protein [Syntrophobacteraceae bacterium]
MKFRTTAIYALILIVIGGVYAGMRMQKEKARRQEKKARHVFTFSPESVTQVEIKSGRNKPVLIKKSGNWTISSPVVSEVDNTQLNGLLSTLHNMEMARKIGKTSGNLAAFGLAKPSLVVRFLTGSKWLELETGAKNPVETDRYAKAGKNGQVFMMTSQTYDDLNKSLTDLRKKELFSWNPEQVKEFQVKWRNGDQLDLVRQGDTGMWKSKTQPDLKISGDKVGNLLDGLHWLRAVDFLAKGAMPASPDLDVQFQLKDGKRPELQVSLPGPGIKQAIATSSELDCPVLLSTYFLSSIPHTADSLVDRSLLSSETSNIKKISWKTAKSAAEFVRINGQNWGSVEGKAAPKPLRTGLQIESLLAFVHNTEYIKSVSPASKPAPGATDSVQFVDVFGRVSSLTWIAPAPGNTGPVDVWLEREGSVSQVQVKPQDIQHINAFLAAACRR